MTVGNRLAPEGWPITRPIGVQKLHYVHGGEAYYIIGGSEYRLKAGYVYLFPFNLEFRSRQNPLDRLDHLYFDFFTTVPIISDMFYEYRIEEDSLAAQYIALLERLVAEYGASVGDTHFAIRPDTASSLRGRLIFSALEALVELVDEKLPLGFASDRRVLDTLEYIERNYSHALTVEELAERVFLNKNHFIRLFGGSLHITPYKYLQIVRLRRADSMLKNGATLAEAASATCYRDASSLRRALRLSYYSGPQSPETPRKVTKINKKQP